jgi:phosphatidylserine decarboxylase
LDREKGLTRFPVAREGLGLIVPALIVSLVLAWLGLFIVGAFFFALFLFFVYFFRNPERSSTSGPDELIAPADGKVTSIVTLEEGEFLKGKARRISIFMNVTDVHVNRAPCEGEVLRVEHRNGRFLMAFKEEVDRENERNYVLYGRGEERFLLVQIAGLLARRIFCYVKENDRLQKGQPFGMIALGSRVDLYIPENYEPAVQVNQKVKCGLTVLARAGGRG